MIQIRFHIEGGVNKNQDIERRKAFHRFFAVLERTAQDAGGGLRPILHGSRRAAYDQFCRSLRSDPLTYHVLLVDSEDPVAHRGECWRHLRERAADGWEKPPGAEEEQCQLMAQAIEAWFFADPEALSTFYGAGFQAGSLPNRNNVEEIPKREHLPKLEAASRNTQKGLYHKTRHLPSILSALDAEKVRERAWHCDRIFLTLAKKFGKELPPRCRIVPPAG